MSNKLETKLSEYAKTPAYPFHMPGHKRIMNPMECSSAKNHSPGIYSLDITEIDKALGRAEDLVLRERLHLRNACRNFCRSTQRRPHSH